MASDSIDLTASVGKQSGCGLAGSSILWLAACLSSLLSPPPLFFPLPSPPPLLYFPLPSSPFPSLPFPSPPLLSPHPLSAAFMRLAKVTVTSRVTCRKIDLLLRPLTHGTVDRTQELSISGIHRLRASVPLCWKARGCPRFPAA